MHHQSKFHPNHSMPYGDSDFTIFGPQNYGLHFTHMSALTVRKFWSTFYPLMACTSARLHACILYVPLSHCKQIA